MSDNIFIHNENDYNEFKKTLTKHSRIKIKFICPDCGKEKEKFGIYCSSYPIICSSCIGKRTNLEKYGDENYRNFAKRESTCLIKYGTRHPMQNTAVLEKCNETNMKKYGTKWAITNEEIRNRIMQTCNEHYGCNIPFQSDEIKYKISDTIQHRYNARWITASLYFRKTRKRKYEYDGLKFDSKPEMEFYKKLKAENADFEYQPNVCFEYEYEGKTHKYYPDFRIGDKYIELKGAHFFDENGKMINPFDRSQDDLYEAKHQCMLKHNVDIITV